MTVQYNTSTLGIQIAYTISSGLEVSSGLHRACGSVHSADLVVPIMGIGWSSQLAVPIWADAEHVVQLHNFNIVTSAPRSYYFAVHRGPIWVCHVSHLRVREIKKADPCSVGLDVRLPYDGSECQRGRFGHIDELTFRLVSTTRCCMCRSHHSILMRNDRAD